MYNCSVEELQTNYRDNKTDRHPKQDDYGFIIYIWILHITHLHLQHC